MDVNFEYKGVKASSRLEEYTLEKINKLSDRYDFIVRADVFFKMENTSSPDTGKICALRLSVPGPRMLAEASHGDFKQSVLEAVNDMERQLKKKKEKMKSY